MKYIQCDDTLYNIENADEIAVFKSYAQSKNHYLMKITRYLPDPSKGLVSRITTCILPFCEESDKDAFMRELRLFMVDKDKFILDVLDENLFHYVLGDK